MFEAPRDSQRNGKFDFDEIINGRQIFVANLSSGLLTDDATGIFGTFLMAKLIAATFRRASMPRERRVPFYCYVDEFQNFAQVSIGFDKVLAEARKYGLVLAGLANQFVGQLSREIRAAIIGNVGTLVAFRLGTKDAELLSDEFGVFTKDEILSLEMGQALVRVGSVKNVFNVATYPAPPVTEDHSEVIVARSRRYFATKREEVETRLRSETTSRESAVQKRSNTVAKMDHTEALEVREEEWCAWDDFVG